MRVTSLVYKNVNNFYPSCNCSTEPGIGQTVKDIDDMVLQINVKSLTFFHSIKSRQKIRKYKVNVIYLFTKMLILERH